MHYRIGSYWFPLIPRPSVPSAEFASQGDRRVLGALLVALRDPDREVCCRAVDAISSLYDFVPGDLTLVPWRPGKAMETMAGGTYAPGNTSRWRISLVYHRISVKMLSRIFT